MSKVLIVHSYEGQARLKQFRQIKEHFNIHEIDFCVIRHKPLSKKVTEIIVKMPEYDVIWFHVPSHWVFIHRDWLEPLLQDFPGKVIPTKDLWSLTRFDVHNTWLRLGIRTSRIVRGSPDALGGIPFGPPWIVRGFFGDGGWGRETIIHSDADLNRWQDENWTDDLQRTWWTFFNKNFFTTAEYIVEEFINTSRDDYFHCARGMWVDGELIPQQVVYAPRWNVKGTLSFDNTAITQHHHLTCFDHLPEAPVVIWKLKLLCSMIGNFGFIDFSIDHNGDVVPWEININPGYGTILDKVRSVLIGQDSEWSVVEETVQTTTKLYNSIFKMLDIDLTITEKEMDPLWRDYCLTTESYKLPERKRNG